MTAGFMNDIETQPEAQAAAEAVTTIATHDGIFHADDVMAVAIIQLALEGQDQPHADVIRTRDPALIAAATYAVDVGGVYDPATQRYDHHQRGLSPRGNGTPYASAGLVWRALYREVLAGFSEHEAAIRPEHADEIYELVDSSIIQSIDAADNGKVQDAYTVSNVVSAMNRQWYQEELSADEYANLFEHAAGFCALFLVSAIDTALGVVLARGKVHEAWDDSPRDACPGVLVLEEYMPWQDAVAGIPQVKLVVFPSMGADGGWKLQVVEQPGPDRKPRVPLPSAWRGLEGEELDAARKCVEHPGAIFCHKAGFIAGHKTQAGALEMAKWAIDFDQTLADWTKF